MRSRIGYRAWQFRQSFRNPPSLEEWHRVESLLSPRELALFRRLPPPDQNHSLRVLRALEREGAVDPDLRKAALLHDIGKILHPLRRWERILAVLLPAFFPGLAARMGEGRPRGFNRALAVLHQHPAWGAELAEQAGCSPRVISLIRYHESGQITGILDQAGLELLYKLQQADNQN